MVVVVVNLLGVSQTARCNPRRLHPDVAMACATDATPSEPKRLPSRERCRFCSFPCERRTASGFDSARSTVFFLNFVHERFKTKSSRRLGRFANPHPSITGMMFCPFGRPFCIFFCLKGRMKIQCQTTELMQSSHVYQNRRYHVKSRIFRIVPVDKE